MSTKDKDCSWREGGLTLSIKTFDTTYSRIQTSTIEKMFDLFLFLFLLRIAITRLQNENICSAFIPFLLSIAVTRQFKVIDLSPSI